MNRTMPPVLHDIRFAAISLGAHRLRTFLAMLGIVIGVAAVMVTLAVGSGARAKVAEQIRSLGANLVGVSAGSATAAGLRLGDGALPRLSVEDADAIQAEVAGVVVAAPILYGKTQFVHASVNWGASFRGITPEYFAAREWSIASGREMAPIDKTRGEKLAWIGETVRRELLGAAEPIGATIRIKGVPFVVAGVLASKGRTMDGQDQDDVVLVPMTAARRHLVGAAPGTRRFVHSIFVKYEEGADVQTLMAEIRSLLRQRHKLARGREDSFILSDFTELTEARQGATRTVSLMLASVAGVSLVVGGIGIMNIMLVSMVERTREIGLRMALGARRRDIQRQFLVEALAIAVCGGVLGVGLGLVGAVVLARSADWPLMVEGATVVLALAFAVVVGLLSGAYPAHAAARLSPIEALRRE